MRRENNVTKHGFSIWQPFLLPFLSSFVVSMTQNSFLVTASGHSLSLGRLVPYSALEALLAIFVLLGTCAYFSRLRELGKQRTDRPAWEHVALPVIFAFFSTNPNVAYQTWEGYLLVFLVIAGVCAWAQVKHDLVGIVGDRWHGILERRLLQLSVVPTKRSDLLPLDLVYCIFLGILVINRFSTSFFPQY